uniref:Fe2OG dioxygenase domain-containing protein n=2 Tax=Oryza brachyantha TaxID=4533 RepID=J3KX08_ORYBR
MVRVRQLPNEEHVPDSYGAAPDELGIAPEVYQALECHLPSGLVGAPAEVKRYFMRSILQNYVPSPAQRTRTQNQREYRERILSAYQPLHQELYTDDPSIFLTPTFLQAITVNTEESITSLMMEVSPGVYAFHMLKPSFCEMLMAEANHFFTWARTADQRIMSPITLDMPAAGRGACLFDFGLQGMLDNLMKNFISPIATVLYPEVGGSTLDSHHSYVVEYDETDPARGLHVDDSEVTLNICLGKHFTGADMYFRGIRCGNHINSGMHDEEHFVHPNVPGQVMLHHGSHRHGVFPVTSGQRVNMVMWCRSSLFRDMKKCMNDFSGFCGECQFERTARQVQHLQELTARISINAQEDEAP